MTNRREFLAAGSAAVAAAAQGGAAIVVDPKPLFDISPHLYMQFMEPLGVTDSSVEAAWDYERDDWRKDLVETTRDLAPDVLRWGGILQPVLQLAGRRGAGAAAAADVQLCLGRLGDAPRGDARVRGLLPPGGRGAALLRELFGRRRPALPQGQPLGRREGGRRLGLLRQRSGPRRAQAERQRAAVEHQAVAAGQRDILRDPGVQP